MTASRKAPAPGFSLGAAKVADMLVEALRTWVALSVKARAGMRTQVQDAQRAEAGCEAGSGSRRSAKRGSQSEAKERAGCEHRRRARASSACSARSSSEHEVSTIISNGERGKGRARMEGGSVNSAGVLASRGSSAGGPSAVLPAARACRSCQTKPNVRVSRPRAPVASAASVVPPLLLLPLLQSAALTEPGQRTSAFERTQLRTVAAPLGPTSRRASRCLEPPLWSILLVPRSLIVPAALREAAGTFGRSVGASEASISSSTQLILGCCSLSQPLTRLALASQRAEEVTAHGRFRV